MNEMPAIAEVPHVDAIDISWIAPTREDRSPVARAGAYRGDSFPNPDELVGVISGGGPQHIWASDRGDYSTEAEFLGLALEDRVRTCDSGHIRVVELDAGEHNLLNPHNMELLRSALISADAEQDVEGILLTSASLVFCGGLDLPAIQAGADPVEFAGALVRLLQLFPRLTKPIAAAVQGDAFASGAALVAAVDYAVAVPDAMIGSQEVSIGIWPMVAQVPLVHRIGARAAMESIGSGDPFTASRARELGLIQAIADPADLLGRTRDWLVRASRGASAHALGRPSLYHFADLDYDTALNAALERFASMFNDDGSKCQPHMKTTRGTQYV
jgi:enoyl-CoA hydratase/carnithine racemase